MKNRVYYKVVSVIEGKFYSSNTSSLKDKSTRYVKIRYRHNQFTYPELKGSKLFVFNTLEGAQAYACMDHRIYECEVINPVRMFPIMYGPNEEVCDFWRLKGEGRSTRKYERLKHFNCSGCDAVKITKLVKKDKKRGKDA